MAALLLQRPHCSDRAVERGLLHRVADGLKISASSIRAAAWTDNRLGWLSVMLGSRMEVLAREPDYAALSELCIGVIGPWDPIHDGQQAQFEARAFSMAWLDACMSIWKMEKSGLAGLQ